jgi:hypothetical protein
MAEGSSQTAWGDPVPARGIPSRGGYSLRPLGIGPAMALQPPVIQRPPIGIGEEREGGLGIGADVHSTDLRMPYSS